MIIVDRGRARPQLPRRQWPVTICIAVGCDQDSDDRKIILCTDRLLSSVLGSTETGIKIRFMGQNWSCLTAGDETDIVGLLWKLHHKFDKATNEPTVIDETNVGTFIRDAWAEQKRQK